MVPLQGAYPQESICSGVHIHLSSHTLEYVGTLECVHSGVHVLQSVCSPEGGHPRVNALQGVHTGSICTQDCIHTREYELRSVNCGMYALCDLYTRECTLKDVCMLTGAHSGVHRPWSVHALVCMHI